MSTTSSNIQLEKATPVPPDFKPLETPAYYRFKVPTLPFPGLLYHLELMDIIKLRNIHESE